MGEDVQDIQLGTRFFSGGEYGTIRYVGEVPPYKGVWLGVEWDDLQRGKHDGSKDGKQYFKTSHPTSGSFIRVHKADLGVSFLEAVRDRYGRLEDINAGVDLEELFVTGKNKKQTTVEFVGAQKVNIQQSQFQNLTELVLRSLNVSRCDSLERIANLLPNVENLDVSKGLLTSWEKVAQLAQALKKLNTLNVSDNRLTLPENAKELAGSFQGIQTLLMNRMNYSWEDVLTCAPMWSDVKELHLCFNRFTTLADPRPLLTQLTFLNLEANPLSDWQEVLKLGKLEKLERLILNDTGISTIKFPVTDPQQKTALFPGLRSLSVMNNKLAEWDCVTELNRLQKLKELKIMKNPLSEKVDEASFRQIVIAKISSLETCNKSKITPKERKEAELDYLRNFGKEWRDSGGHQDEVKNRPSIAFITSHPRYQELIKLYGAPEDSEMVKMTTALKNNLLKVHLECAAFKEPVTKRLPATMTVGKLKALAHRLFKADAEFIRLSYLSHRVKNSPEIDLDNDMREIGFYSIENEDTILVRR